MEDMEISELKVRGGEKGQSKENWTQTVTLWAVIFKHNLSQITSTKYRSQVSQRYKQSHIFTVFYQEEHFKIMA